MPEVVKGHDTQTVVDISAKVLGECALVGILHSVFLRTHEQVGIARAHLCAHGDSAALTVKITVELKHVHGEHQLS